MKELGPVLFTLAYGGILSALFWNFGGGAYDLFMIGSSLLVGLIASLWERLRTPQ
jgi:hypothetical protein